MYNWCYLFVFKVYIDYVICGGFMYYFDEKGNIVGVLDQYKFLFIIMCGVDLSEGSLYVVMDVFMFVLKVVFKFIGVEYMIFIDV